MQSESEHCLFCHNGIIIRDGKLLKRKIDMKSEVIQVKGITFVGKSSSGHWIPMDGPSDFQGSDAASRPKELILIGLGGCTGADVSSILHKMKEKIERFEIEIEAESADEHPKVFTKIHILYKFWGQDLKKENLEKAISLSQERYCSVSAMLRKACEITHTFTINPTN
jgi:putative redox protein